MPKMMNLVTAGWTHTHTHTQKSQMLQCPDGCTEKPVRVDGAGTIFLSAL